MNITPETARSFADDATLKAETPTRIEKGQVFYSLVTDDDRTVATDLDKGDAELLAIAPDLAQTIAEMTEEWGVEADGNSLFPVNEEWHPNGEYFTECRADAEGVRDRMAKLNQHVLYRLVRRLVGPAEVVE